MFKVDLFAEDAAQEMFLRRLIEHRLAGEYSTSAKVHTISATGGHGNVQTELKEYVRQVLRYQMGLPDLIVVAIDANCEGYRDRKKTIAEITHQLSDRVVLAIPDPHIERWLLLDSHAFKRVLGQSCSAPDLKCAKDRYKNLLVEAVRDTGVEPLIGGLEWTDEIVDAMELEHVSDTSLKDLLDDLQTRFRHWARH